MGHELDALLASEKDSFYSGTSNRCPIKKESLSEANGTRIRVPLATSNKESSSTTIH